jgi:hypothetical protein
VIALGNVSCKDSTTRFFEYGKYRSKITKAAIASIATTGNIQIHR